MKFGFALVLVLLSYATCMATEPLTTVQENQLLLGMRLWGTATTATGNGGTATVSGEEATLRTNGATGFAYMILNINSVVPAKRGICISYEVRSEGAAFVKDNLALSGTYVAAGGKTISRIKVPTKIGDRFGMRFVLTSQGGVALRIGINVLESGDEGSDRTLIVRRPVMEIIDPNSPSKQCYGEGIPAHSASVLPYRSDLSYSESTNDNGRLIFTRIYTQPIPNYSYGIIIGDSISVSYLTPMGWPNVLRGTHPQYAFRQLAKGGIQLSTIASWIAAELATPSETDSQGVQPSFAVVQGGVNDVITGSYAALPLQTMITSMETIVKALNDKGIKKIVLINIHPFGNHVNYSLARGNDETILRYNAWLRGFAQAKGYGYVNVYDSVKDETDPLVISATYDNGDGLHLNSAGETIIAEAVADELDRILQ